MRQKEPAALLPDVTGTDMPAYSNRLLHKNSICSGWRQSLCAVEQYLDESTKWLYAEEKMQKYGCSTLRRKKAMTETGKLLDALFEGYGRSNRNGSGNLYDSPGKKS